MNGGSAPMAEPKKKKMSKRMGVSRIEIEKADNGMISKTRYNHADPNDNYSDEEVAVHPTKQHMVAHITKKFGNADLSDSQTRRKVAMDALDD